MKITELFESHTHSGTCPECGGQLVEQDQIHENKDACYRKVKSRYRVWPSAYACVPEKSSRALSRTGWKSVDELTIGEDILTYNIEKDELEFKPILNLHRYKHAPTTVIRSGNTGFIFECTPNHKWVIKFPAQKSERISKYVKINGVGFMETKDMMEAKSNKCIVVNAPYKNGVALSKDKIFKYGDNWVKYILDITAEQRQSWLFSAIVYDGNQLKTQRISENTNHETDLDWIYSGNHGKQSFGFKQKDIEHRDAFLLSAFLNCGTVTWKAHKTANVFSCSYISNKRYKNLSNFKIVRDDTADVWCPETENGTWVMIQETDGNGIITITGNSGALVKCRKVGAANWGKKSKNESFDPEYDDEAGMAQSNLHTAARAVRGLLKTIKNRDNLPEWAQEKIAKAEMMLVSVWDYLLSQKEQGFDPKISESVIARDLELVNEDLRKWFREKWVRFNPQGKIMGPCARGSKKEGKPKCLPQKKAQALGKKGRASAAARKRREDPNPERRGPAKNVATRRK